MSHIGKKPIHIKSGVDIKIENGKVTATGQKGTLDAQIPSGIVVETVEGVLKVKPVVEGKEFEKFLGLTRALIANLVEGVSSGFEKKLELSGVGYRARVDGEKLVLNVGFANPVQVTPPSGVTIQVAENVITVSGANKQQVGDLASKIRSIRVPDPYKAKGIKYVGEKIRRKVGKAAKAIGAGK